MNNKLSNFLDLLDSNQINKLAEAVDAVAEAEMYAQIARDTDSTVEAVKSAALLQECVMEGFFSGLEDLTSQEDEN